MMSSMTAFARFSNSFTWGTITWEIKSVNHRYMELMVRMPESFRELELIVREQVARHLKRGKIECQLKYVAQVDANANLQVNKNVLKQLSQISADVKAILKEVQPPRLMEILAWPEVLQSTEIAVNAVQKDIIASLDVALQEIVKMRQREGQTLQKFILEHLQNILSYIATVKQRMPVVLVNQREKIFARLADLKLEVNQERMEQEWLLLAQRMDVTEEIERLQTHVEEAQRILTAGGVVGRQLDFLMQELNREANTLAAKSMDIEITHAAVELKVLIEQIREQVQNIE